MGKLTTHVLDTANGRPGANMHIELWSLDDDRAPNRVCTAITNSDGRCEAPLLDGSDLQHGRYQLLFHAGDYFRALGTALPAQPFLDTVVVRFGIDDPAAHYHVPLLISPYGYSTYRGS